MKLKSKSWLWKLLFPFAHNNYTTVGNTLFYPKNKYPTTAIIAHEQIHSEQMKKYSTSLFLFFYLFCFPFFYNPFRFRWEYEAYTKGTGLTDAQARKILRSYRYGFLF